MSISPDEFKTISSILHKEAAIVLEGGKEYLVEARLIPLMNSEGVASFAELIRKISGTEGTLVRRKVVDAMTTNETSFFRDLEPFEVLRKHIIPTLIKNRAHKRQLVIWCAASSTGQEPYSLAMLFSEHFPELENWDVQILASDLSETVLKKAKEALFSQAEVNRGLPATLLVKYFEKVDTNWRLKPQIRGKIRFFEQNLIRPWTAIPPCDVVLMRNVLIYFDIETKKAILEKVRKVLAPDGYFFLGSSETTLNLDAQFERVPVERSSCYQKKA